MWTSKPEDKAQFIYKLIYGERQIELFKNEMCQIKWNSINKALDNSKTAYKSFFHIHFETYDKYSKAKTIQNPWITILLFLLEETKALWMVS